MMQVQIEEATEIRVGGSQKKGYYLDKGKGGHK